MGVGCVRVVIGWGELVACERLWHSRESYGVWVWVSGCAGYVGVGGSVWLR